MRLLSMCALCYTTTLLSGYRVRVWNIKRPIWKKQFKDGLRSDWVWK